MEYFKLPRLFTAEHLSNKENVLLTDTQTHYLKNVMRRKEGDYLRLFDGINGEWLGIISALSKKSAEIRLEKQIAPQPQSAKKLRFVFSPIKKNRMDWMIEKMVELGVTDFQPVLFQNTEIRKINTVRIMSQIFEAAEQCERFTIPTLHEVKKLDAFLTEDDFNGLNYACLERFDDAASIDSTPTNSDAISWLIGPEGGFTKEEKKLISSKMTALDLGETILRCETAAIKAAVLLGK